MAEKLQEISLILLDNLLTELRLLMCCEKGNICTHTVQIQEFQYLNVSVFIIWEVLFSIV